MALAVGRRQCQASLTLASKSASSSARMGIVGWGRQWLFLVFWAHVIQSLVLLCSDPLANLFCTSSLLLFGGQKLQHRLCHILLRARQTAVTWLVCVAAGKCGKRAADSFLRRLIFERTRIAALQLSA
jgi:hypothetical protein